MNVFITAIGSYNVIIFTTYLCNNACYTVKSRYRRHSLTLYFFMAAFTVKPVVVSSDVSLDICTGVVLLNDEDRPNMRSYVRYWLINMCVCVCACGSANTATVTWRFVVFPRYHRNVRAMLEMEPSVVVSQPSVHKKHQVVFFSLPFSLTGKKKKFEAWIAPGSDTRVKDK